jgi:pimeloyl-ACP methyl ester carboxylesterase
VDARKELVRFSKPLLCISAKRDWIVPAKSTATIRSLKPDATFVEVDGPHMLLQTRSEELWKSIGAFLSRVERGES